MIKSLRNILNIALFIGAFALPGVAFADDGNKAQTEQMDPSQVSVTVSESNLRVKNAEGGVLQIFSLTGEKMMTMRIDSQSKSIDLSQMSRGVYIVKIGKYTRKIYLL